jgi:hypothetical protein
MNGRAMEALLELYNDAARDAAAAADAPVLDLARLMPKQISLYYDSVHYTDAGAAQVGSIIAAELCPIIAVQFPDHVVAPCS